MSLSVDTHYKKVIQSTCSGNDISSSLSISKGNQHTLSVFLIKGFVFFGVLGNLIPITSSLKAFRFYYLMLPVIILHFGVRKISVSAYKLIITSLPLIVYLLSSAVFAYFGGDGNVQDGIVENPIIRFILLLCLFFATVLMSSSINNIGIDLKFDLILLYIHSFILTAIIGIVFFVGYYMGYLSLTSILKFQVQVQIGAGGLFRISPGSYPNEYGTVASFAASLITLLLLYKRQLSKEKLIFHNQLNIVLYAVFLILSVLVLFLSTTRSAYYSYIFALLYIIHTKKGILQKCKVFLIIGFTFFSLLALVQNYIYDIKPILVESLKDAFQSNSVKARFTAWGYSVDSFFQSPMLGIGFGRLGSTHNLYLQLIAEIGLVGLLIFTFTFILCRNIHLKRKIQVSSPQTMKYEMLSKAKNLAILHVIWFSTNNHNLNHHLTWFCVLLILISTYKPTKENTLTKKGNIITAGGAINA
jgi:O-antigen ligase